MVTPLGFLLLASLGIYASIRKWRSEPTGMVLVGSWATLIVIRSLPHTPGHDGVRLLLPAFGILAVLGGMGARFALDRWGARVQLAIASALLEGALSVWVMMPVPLSYFSPLVGGLPGAAALGMEPTYYWDALGPDARHWLDANTSAGRTFEFASFPWTWMYLRRTGGLPRKLSVVDPGKPQWYVLQNRPGSFSDADRSLVAESQPAYRVSKLSVPLIWIFPFTELERRYLPRNQHSDVSR
jgi:hypothetical protein